MDHVPRLAVFDVDGTIAVEGEVPKEVIKGIQHLQKLGCITTISTGRGYTVLKLLLGDLFETLISPEALLIVQHGTKIVTRSGELIFGEFFSESEIEHIVDFTRA